MTHQRRHMGNKPVEQQSHKECTQDTLHADQFHQSGTQEHHGQHKDELHHPIIITTEKPTTDTRKHPGHEQPQHHKLDNEPQPEQATRLALEQTTDNSQHQQRKRIGNCRTAHRNAHASLARHAVTYHNGISNQRMRSIHTGKQYRSKKTVFQQHHIGHHTDTYRNDECQQAQYNSF